MAEAALVEQARLSAAKLADAIARSPVNQLARALFVSDDGDWRLAIVSADVERDGRLTVARQLHSAATDAGVGGEEIGRLLILGTSDPEALALVAEDLTGRRGVQTDELPGFHGHVLWRSPSGRRFVAERVQAELQDALGHAGFLTQPDFKLEIGWRADLRVTRGSNSALIEVTTADPRSWKSRLRDAAGVANLANMPVVLVLVSPVALSEEMLTPRGVIPIAVTDWRDSGPEGVLSALSGLGL